MRQDEMNKVVDEVVALMIDVADDYLSEMEEQLEVTRSPEKLLGKRYEEFTSQDFSILSQIYGEEEPNPLSNLIFTREYEKLKILEAEEM